MFACSLRTAAALHQALELWYITHEPLLFLCIPAPPFLIRTEIHLHDLCQDLALALLLHSVDQLVEDPGAGDKLLALVHGRH